MKKRLLILSASIGAGHFKAGEALCQAYVEKFGGEACHVDFFRYVSPHFSRIVERSYYLVTKHAPSIYKLLYQMEEHPYSPVKRLEVYFGLRKYRELIKDYQPDAIISTHFLPAAVVSYMYPEITIPNGVVLTDYVSHPIWTHPKNQLFFVAHQEMRNELLSRGIEDERIRVTGIPISPNFTKGLNRAAIKEKLRLNPNLPVILIMSGGNAIGPLQEVIEELHQLKDGIQIVVITGRNRDSYRDLKKLLNEAGLSGRIRGFTRIMHEWMVVSDLLISKAGGLTVTEALASGLPMLIVRPTPGQEDGNTNFLTNFGAAIHVKNIDELASTVADLFTVPDKLNEMSRKARSLSNPSATNDILSEIDLLIENNKCALSK